MAEKAGKVFQAGDIDLADFAWQAKCDIGSIAVLERLKCLFVGGAVEKPHPSRGRCGIHGKGDCEALFRGVVANREAL
ncbi:MAG: hypothetical protein CL812_12615 [Confluentimicrobium sp.]|nr:hypothetical protein [Actibacterium sp.]